MRVQFAVITFSLLSVLVAGGCSKTASNAPPSKDELKAFKGGPMPPEARKKMEESMRMAAEQRAREAAAAKGAARTGASTAK